MDINKVEEIRELLETFSNVRMKLASLNRILGTDRNDTSKRNVGGFLVSPTLYYSIYEQIKSEYMAYYNELKSQIE